MTSYWIPESISVDDKYVALTIYYGHSYRLLYIVDITVADPTRDGHSSQRERESGRDVIQ